MTSNEITTPTPPLSADNVARQADPDKERVYTLSVGRSRKAQRWESTRMTWDELRKRLSEPVRTKETTTEYQALSKDAQVDAKDVGGYVAGELKDGKRKKSALLYRSLLTIDMDSAGDPDEVYKHLREALPVQSFFLHTTHSHTPEAPRLRLIVPLDRDVSAEEYRALIRRVGEMVGAEEIDPTTDQGERLMFWPSVPSDGVYTYYSFDGNPLPVDKWLMGEDPQTLLRQVAERAEDPLKKRNIVGWFCRAYSIYDALEELIPGLYAPTGQPNRWTFVGGHTTGGAIIYDEGRYLYSYHATDPAEGQLLNAFDLVRIHKFAQTYDTQANPRTGVQNLPSYKMMCDFAGSLPKVEQERMKDLMAQVTLGDFDTSGVALEERKRALGDVLEPGEEAFEAYDPMEDVDEFNAWASKLIYREDRSGVLHFDNSHFNVILILDNDKRIKGAFARDTFNERAVVMRDLPWRERKTGAPDYVTDDDVSQLRSWLSSHYYKIDNRAIIDDALVTVENRYAFHPIREYLQSLEWDGIPRAEELLIKTLNADDTQLTREITIKWLKAAVARVLEPGIKFDNMLILYGPKGCGKSTFLERLGRDWFSGTLVPLDNIRQASAQLQGAWIIEDPELIGILASADGSAKGFLSKTQDDFIAPYGRHKTYRKRQCVFAGTTNENDFLKDPMGERRYWVVQVRKADEPDFHFHPYVYLTPDIVDQVWAEVYYTYTHVDRTLILTPESEEALRRSQRHYREIDVWEDAIQTFLDLPAPLGYRTLPYDTLDGYYYNQQGVAELDSEALEERTVVSFDDICRWALGFRIEGRIPRDARKRINRIMSSMPDWRPALFRLQKRATRGWRKISDGGTD